MVGWVITNPTSFMTDPELTDATYVEPITPEVIEKGMARGRPDACLPTLGGQTALNAAIGLAEAGTLDAYGVELVGADTQAIRTAEDRRLFRAAMEEIGIDLPRSGFAYSIEEARGVMAGIGLPAIVRASFTLGGCGAGIAGTGEECEPMVAGGLRAAPISARRDAE